jgi:uncharacterized membrane protein YhhN
MTALPGMGTKISCRAGWLLLPFGLAIVALATRNVCTKMAVAVSCAIILTWTLGWGHTSRRDSWWVVAALCFSAAGDWFLFNKGSGEAYFLGGIASFFCAHLGYLVFASRQGRLDWRILGILLGVYLLYYVFGLRPVIKSLELALAVLFYLLISCVVFSTAWGMRMGPQLKWPFITGIGLIVFSDTLISFGEFLRWKRGDWLILPTYYLAQLCVSWTVLVLCSTEALPKTRGAVEENGTATPPPYEDRPM